MRFGTRELILFTMVLALPVVAYFAAFRPQNAKIERMRGEVVHKREMLDKYRSETARNADLEKANALIAERVAEIEQRLPSGKEIDQIVRQVSQLAVDAGLAPPTLKTAKPVAAARYKEQPLELTTTGSFHGFYEFLVAMERMPRITRIVEMTIKHGEDTEIEVAFTLSIYFRDDEGGAS